MEEAKGDSLLHRFQPYIALIAVLSVVVYIAFHLISNIDRGFDLTDEGYYLLSLQDNYNQKYTLTAWYLIFNKTFFFLELNIVNVRWIRLGMILLSASLFSFSLWRIANSLGKKKLKLVHFFLILNWVILGIFMAYFLFPQSPSYNDLTHYIGLISIGLVLIALSTKTTLASLILAFISGSVAFWAVFTKLNTAPILWLILVLLAYFLSKSLVLSTKQRVFFFLALCAGLGSSFAIALLNKETENFLTNIPATLEIIQSASNGYDGHSLFIGVIEGIKSLLVIFSQSLLLYAFYKLSRFFLRSKFKTLTVEIISGTLLAVGIYLMISWLPKDRENYLLPIVFLSSISTIHVFESLRSGRLNWYLLGLFLLCLGAPLIFSFGTNNLLLLSAFSYVVFWLLPMTVFYHHFKGVSYLIFTVFLLLNIVTLFGKTYTTAPYRQPSYAQQNTEFKYGGRNMILLDKNRAEYLEGLKNALQKIGYKPGSHTLGFHKVPGIVYLLKGDAFGGLLWDKKFDKLYCANLEAEKIEPNEVCYIIQNNPPSEFLQECLKNNDIDLSRYYVMDSIKTVPELKLTNEWTYIYLGPFIDVKYDYLNGIYPTSLEETRRW